LILRSSISLPNPSAIRNWISNIDTNIGFLKNVLNEIANFPDEDKYCCLILDSMSIKKEIHWDRVNHKYIRKHIFVYLKKQII